MVPVVGVAVAIIASILIPCLVLMVRLIIQWTKFQDQLQSISSDLQHLVEDKEKVHNAMFSQMNNDREATNLRLRWLEEHLWRITKGA